jgi:outer membrane lipoprotein-sorting protein
VPAGEQALPAKTATLDQLIQLVNQSAEKTQALKLTVIYQLTGGSINTGEISKYRETDGFILVKKPRWIRLIGQAFKVTVFDMVSDGREFRIYVPPKNKFIQGLNNQEIKPRKDVPVELRPQHIFQALVLEPLQADKERDMIALDEDQEGKHKYYIVNVVSRTNNGMGSFRRKIWIDRFDLSLVRQKLYEKDRIVSDISYIDLKDFEGGSYPSIIDFKRPQEEYSLRLRITKAALNEPLRDEQFVLERPSGSELVDLAKAP